jgi:hypothetical protein
MSELVHYTRGSGFTPSPAVRRLIAKVRGEASERVNRGELGAWMHTFARLATMTQAELVEHGCPDQEVAPLLRFAMDRAIEIAAPVVPVFGENDAQTLRLVSEQIARIARLKWGTKAANDAYIDWLKSGVGYIQAELRRDRKVPQGRRQ